MGLKMARVLVTAVAAALCTFLIVVAIREGLGRAGLWVAVVGAGASVVAAAAAVWPLIRQSSEPAGSERRVPDWVVDRPAELASVVSAVLRSRTGVVGITTGLYGAGGFGKTTLANMVCADRKILRKFRGHVYFVTVGRDVRSPRAVAAKVSELISLVTGERADFTDPELAGQRLGRLFDTGPQRLLVVDDVWEPNQLAPFAVGGRRCARIVTTRNSRLLAGVTSVLVDQMSGEEARSLLTSGLQEIDPVIARQLLQITGRWPLLLRLANKILVDGAKRGEDVSAVGEALLRQIGAGGPGSVDDLAVDGDYALEVDRPQERARAVRSTIEASTGLLQPQAAERLKELCVFAEDEEIPFGLVAKLWKSTGGLDELQSWRLCTRLGELALVSLSTASSGATMTMHDVVRDILHVELGPARVTTLHVNLVDAVHADLAESSSPIDSPADELEVPWWEIAPDSRYLWDHLVEHMLAADRLDEASSLASDLRWVSERLALFGPAAPAADLSSVHTPTADRLLRELASISNLVAETDPPEAVVDILHSRVGQDQHWGPQVAALRNTCRRPRLVNGWPLPDLPDAGLLRLLPSSDAPVTSLAVSPDGSWLAAGYEDGVVRIWDIVTGQVLATMSNTPDLLARLASGTPLLDNSVQAVAVAPDGTWLATTSRSIVRIWDTATWQLRADLAAGSPAVTLTAAPDSRWLAAGTSRTVRVWETATWHTIAKLSGRLREINAIAIARDRTWLAVGSNPVIPRKLDHGTIRIWDTATWTRRITFPLRYQCMVEALADADADSDVQDDPLNLRSDVYISSTYSWRTDTWPEKDSRQSSNAGRTTGMVRLRVNEINRALAPATARRHILFRNARVAPDGLVARPGRSAVEIWSAVQPHALSAPTDQTLPVTHLANNPAQNWLAAASRSLIEIWDVPSAQVKIYTKLRAYFAVHSIAAAPDGSWLAIGFNDRSVDIWSTSTWKPERFLLCQTGGTEAMVVAPDGSWLATGGQGGIIEIWDTARWEALTALKGHTDWVLSLAASSDLGTLASGSDDRTVRIWDTTSWHTEKVLRGHSGRIEAVAVAPDGSWLVSGSDDGTAVLWDSRTGQVIKMLTNKARWVRAAAISPCGNWLAIGSGDGTIRIWETTSWHAAAMMRVDNAINCCTWIDSGQLAAGGPYGLYIFDFLPEVSTNAPQRPAASVDSDSTA